MTQYTLAYITSDSEWAEKQKSSLGERYKKDTKEFPELIKMLGENDSEIFVVNTDNGHWYPANEFFYMVTINGFTTT